MIVDRNAMNDVEKQILHDANDLFIIRVVAFDRTQGLRQNAIDSPRHIQQFLHEEFGPWGLTGLQRLHQHLHVVICKLRFIVDATSTFKGQLRGKARSNSVVGAL